MLDRKFTDPETQKSVVRIHIEMAHPEKVVG